MGSDVTWTALEECLDALIDYRGKTPEKTASGIPLITAKIVKGGTIEAPTEFIAEDDYQSWMRRGLPKVGDVLLTTEAPLGEVAQLKSERVALAQRIILLRGKQGVLHNGYLKYFFLSEEGHRSLEARASGTTVLGIKQSELRRIEIPVIPYSEQTEIAETLGALDDKIALLRETNATLEAIAQAIFKSWFVDFDPVRAKAEGRDPEGVPPEVADLFPSEFEDSELGAIPKGWTITRVGELLELAYGKALKATDRQPGDVPVYGSGGLTGLHDRALLSNPTVIVGRKGTVGSLYWEDRPCFPIDTVFYVKPKLASLDFCYHTLRTMPLSDMNTDAAVPGLNRENVYRLKLCLPGKGISQAFEEISNTLRMRIRAIQDESDHLLDLRDTLLPRLMSGKLHISEEEA